MQKAIMDIFSNFLIVISMLVIWHNLFNKKINFTNKNNYLCIIVIMIISFFSYYLLSNIFRIFVITLTFVIFIKFLFKKNLKISIITAVFYQIIIMISETTFAIGVSLIFNFNSKEIMNPLIGTFFSSIFVTFFSIFLVNLKFIKSIYNKIIMYSERAKKAHLITICLIVMIISSSVSLVVYYKIQFKYLLIMNLAIILICCIIVIISLNTLNKYNDVNDKYNVSIRSLNDYEAIINEYRMKNHESKNLLLTIRAMIVSKEENITNYIDSIIENKYNDNENLMKKISVIPLNGVRATIYSEILKMQKLKIKYNLYISRKIKNTDLIKLDVKTTIDICKLLGVYLDNAIEEVKNIDKKIIDISIFKEQNYINIKISNVYKSKIDISKMFKERYSTKGNNRGYGLMLSKSIIDSNKLLDNAIEITNSIFSILLKIKYKN